MPSNTFVKCIGRNFISGICMKNISNHLLLLIRFVTELFCFSVQDGFIVGIGKAGNPDVMAGVTKVKQT